MNCSISNLSLISQRKRISANYTADRKVRGATVWSTRKLLMGPSVGSRASGYASMENAGKAAVTTGYIPNWNWVSWNKWKTLKYRWLDVWKSFDSFVFEDIKYIQVSNNSIFHFNHIFCIVSLYIRCCTTIFFL